ncbi:MAG: response regulator transcription factor [Deltaproteobacteria bacterium]|nr:response regulator transcription factor [Deltaproteobacteria bacterium]
MAHESILVVEDEDDIRELLRYNLAREGYRVAAAASGEEALKAARESLPDLVLLDLMLPGLDGLEVCRALKQDAQARKLPIVMLTAKGEEADVVAGLELGADDYVTKPFSLRVLLARLRAVLRRSRAAPPLETEAVAVHGMTIHPGRHEVLIQGRPVDLTATEFRLLHLLARRPGWVFTRGQIVSRLHGQNHAVTERAVDVQVVSLRKKLGDWGKYVETVRGIGYRLRE